MNDYERLIEIEAEIKACYKRIRHLQEEKWILNMRISENKNRAYYDFDLYTSDYTSLETEKILQRGYVLGVKI